MGTHRNSIRMQTFSGLHIGLLIVLVMLPRAASSRPAASHSSDFGYWAGFEVQQSAAAAGDSWQAEFDRGGVWPAGTAGRLTAGVDWRSSWANATVAWRGRVGEHGPASGDLLAARLAAAWGPAELAAGRFSPCWNDAPGQKLLVSEHAPVLDQVHLALGPGRLPWAGGRARAESFLAYLDDAHREIPYPLLWGMRGYWQPADWLHLEAQRTIMMGGAGRGDRLSLADWVDILLGRGESGRGPDYAPSDSDQKFAYLVRLTPRAWARRVLGLHELELYWYYGGEDRFEDGMPMAPGRTYGLRVAPRAGLRIEAEYTNNADDHNLWYYHKVYRSGYTYRGFILGHPMGGDARRWRVRFSGGPAVGGAARAAGPAEAKVAAGRRLWLEVLRQVQGVHRADANWLPVEPGELIRVEVGVSQRIAGREIRFSAGGQSLTGAYRTGENLYAGFARLELWFWGGALAGGGARAR